MDEVAADLLVATRARPSLGALAMQSAWLARVYELAWRPVCFALSTGFSLPSRNTEASLVADRLGEAPGPWLDLSCGAGGVSRRIAERTPKRPIVLVDSSRAMLERARHALPDAIRIRADAARLPFADGAFGAVVNLAALDLYPDPARVIRESARVLGPGGRWVASGFLSSSALFGSTFLRRRVSASTGIHPLSERGLAELVEDAGLGELEVQRFGRYLLLSAEKPAARAPAEDARC